MNDPQHHRDDLRPFAGSDAASAPVRQGFTLRGRTWVYSATLAIAGVLGASGVAYAVEPTVPTQPTVQTQPSGPGVV